MWGWDSEHGHPALPPGPSLWSLGGGVGRWLPCGMAGASLSSFSNLLTLFPLPTQLRSEQENESQQQQTEGSGLGWESSKGTKRRLASTEGRAARFLLAPAWAGLGLCSALVQEFIRHWGQSQRLRAGRDSGGPGPCGPDGLTSRSWLEAWLGLETRSHDSWAKSLCLHTHHLPRDVQHV